MKRLAVVLLALLSVGASSRAFELPSETKQLLVGLASSWNSSHVTLSFYEKKALGWKKVGDSWNGRLGREGLVWGRGLHPVPEGARTKREGDWRAPAGVFDLGAAWGYDGSIEKHPSLHYVRITSRDLWYEDADSPYYNQYRRIDHEPRTRAEKKAQMRQDDYAHSLKLFIAHNAYPDIEPGAGSSIFFHIWRRGGNAPTAGCTTMPESKLRQFIAALDPTKRPLYVLLPEEEYRRYEEAWGLP